MKYLANISVGDLFDWKYCPVCGSELFEVYVGDFTAHTVCENEDCDDVGFHLIIEKDGVYKSLRPKTN